MASIAQELNVVVTQQQMICGCFFHKPLQRSVAVSRNAQVVSSKKSFNASTTQVVFCG
jgi:hypothetical protein